MSQDKYIGMDVHQATISAAVMDANGKLIMECLLETKAVLVYLRRAARSQGDHVMPWRLLLVDAEKRRLLPDKRCMQRDVKNERLFCVCSVFRPESG